MNNLFLVFLIFCLTSCSILERVELKGGVTGTRYSKQPFTKGKHVMSATYPLSERINIKGQISQPYISQHSVDINMPDYGETGLEFLF
jgi:hypothetical protein